MRKEAEFIDPLTKPFFTNDTSPTSWLGFPSHGGGSSTSSEPDADDDQKKLIESLEREMEYQRESWNTRTEITRKLMEAGILPGDNSS